jgi:hypothetical protein
MSNLALIVPERAADIGGFLVGRLVSSSKERLAEAREDWINQRFTLPPGESDYVPYPGRG